MHKRIGDLDRANRVLTMVSQINRSSARAESPDEVYRDACIAAVDCGLFKFAWIGMFDSASGGLRYMTGHGDPCGEEEALLAAGGLADTVRKSGRLCVYNDLLTLPEEMGRGALLQRGFHAMAGIPLCEADKAIGVFLLYTAETECFDDNVVGLLHQVTDDISFSLDHMHDEQRRLAAESKLYYMAFYDAQTGLPNRALLDERLPQLAKGSTALAVFDIRLQRLDKAAQVLGRLAVDEVLRALASRLELVRGSDAFLAHLAGDEFVIVSLDMVSAAEVNAFSTELLQRLSEPVRIGEREVFLRPSIGIVLYPSQERDPAQLLRRARVAAEREVGTGGYRLYSTALDKDREQQVQLEADLHRALQRGEFVLQYQPQLNLRSGRMVGVEALLYWQHPRRGLVGPGGFIRVIEECGLMPEVGTWVLRTACRQAKAWKERGLRSMRMAVNLSALQFRLTGIVDIVQAALQDAGLDSDCLELELTESLILENVEETIDAMHRLKKLGVSLSLDDFGTGYSSLSYLRRYPVDRIKVDQSFIRDMTRHANSAVLVRSILAMATTLGLSTIAEGVETVEQFEYLRKQSCEEMQGFLFSRPVPADDIACMLAEDKRLRPAGLHIAGGYKLLLLHDDSCMVESLRALLGESWNVMPAASASEALALLASHDIGVVVSGDAMPGAGEMDFLHRVNDLYPHAVQILVTRHREFNALARAVNCGAIYKVLCEPVEVNDLREAVREAFQRHEMQVRNQHGSLHVFPRDTAGQGELDI